MSNPTNPNYTPGRGRLVTDRFDFQNHINGSEFNHNSSSIVIDPPISIESVDVGNVQDAIERLKVVVESFDIPDATTTTKGVIQLSGDIAGTASSVTVSGLQNNPISSSLPASGEYLKWTGTEWFPSSINKGSLTGSQTAPLAGFASDGIFSSSISLKENDIEFNLINGTKTSISKNVSGTSSKVLEIEQISSTSSQVTLSDGGILGDRSPYINLYKSANVNIIDISIGSDGSGAKALYSRVQYNDNNSTYTSLRVPFHDGFESSSTNLITGFVVDDPFFGPSPNICMFTSVPNFLRGAEGANSIHIPSGAPPSNYIPYGVVLYVSKDDGLLYCKIGNNTYKFLIELA